ncbi:hypothetical protein Esti_003289 [Eimeria stiedai]
MGLLKRLCSLKATNKELHRRVLDVNRRLRQELERETLLCQDLEVAAEAENSSRFASRRYALGLENEPTAAETAAAAAAAGVTPQQQQHRQQCYVTQQQLLRLKAFAEKLEALHHALPSELKKKGRLMGSAGSGWSGSSSSKAQSVYGLQEEEVIEVVRSCCSQRSYVQQAACTPGSFTNSKASFAAPSAAAAASAAAAGFAAAATAGSKKAGRRVKLLRPADSVQRPEGFCLKF